MPPHLQCYSNRTSVNYSLAHQSGACRCVEIADEQLHVLLQLSSTVQEVRKPLWPNRSKHKRGGWSRCVDHTEWLMHRKDNMKPFNGCFRSLATYEPGCAGFCRIETTEITATMTATPHNTTTSNNNTNIDSKNTNKH